MIAVALGRAVKAVSRAVVSGPKADLSPAVKVAMIAGALSRAGRAVSKAVVIVLKAAAAKVVHSKSHPVGQRRRQSLVTSPVGLSRVRATRPLL